MISETFFYKQFGKNVKDAVDSRLIITDKSDEEAKEARAILMICT